ncbi:MAG: hypothetical protein MJZ38_07910 [archaeon]|nr:hypothetical protein [archaeon]
MHGLLVEPGHLRLILAGIATGDRRQFRTAKRGRIALVDRGSKTILGFAELHTVREVTYRDYLEQRGNDRMTGDLWAQHRPYYELCLRKVEKARPVDVSGFHDDGVWMELPDDIGRRVQKSLLDFRG